MSNSNLTRIEIANILNKEIGISRSESSYFVDTIITEMIESLIQKKIRSMYLGCPVRSQKSIRQYRS